MLFKSLAVAAAVTGAMAQSRPSNTSICDYYTTALLKENSAKNQATLLTLVVNTAVIGNYTKPNVGIQVPGILAKGTFNGEEVNLLPYFSGGLASTNTGGSVGRSVNFLDGGGAAPLMENKASNDTNSNQERLLNHLYSYFGGLLGCTQLGHDGFPAYDGSNSQYKVHKFMDLSNAEVGYFISQVGGSAASFGVADADVKAVGKSLSDTFGYKCAPEAVVIPSQPAALQSICTADDCPLSPNAVCSSYGTAMEPAAANSTNMGGASPSGSGTSASPSATSSMPVSANGATVVGISVAAVAGGLVAMLL